MFSRTFSSGEVAGGGEGDVSSAGVEVCREAHGARREEIPYSLLKIRKWSGMKTSGLSRRGSGICVETIRDVMAGNTAYLQYSDPTS